MSGHNQQPEKQPNQNKRQAPNTVSTPDQRLRLDQLGNYRLTVTVDSNNNTGMDTDHKGKDDGGPQSQQVSLVVPHQHRHSSIHWVGQNLGNYATRNTVRKALRHEFKSMTINGDTFESEHVIGYAVLAPQMPRPGTAGYKALDDHGARHLARLVESKAPAYHEVHELHRDHPGTGSGEISDQYRREQRSALLGEREPVNKGIGPQDAPPQYPYSNAVQLNQLEYAHMLREKLRHKTKDEREDLRRDLEVANTSYLVMVANVNSVTYLTTDNKRGSVNVHCIEKCEQELARIAVVEGRWPTLAEENTARARYGIPAFFELRDGTSCMQQTGSTGETKDSGGDAEGDTTMNETKGEFAK